MDLTTIKSSLGNALEQAMGDEDQIDVTVYGVAPFKSFSLGMSARDSKRTFIGDTSAGRRYDIRAVY